MKPAIRGRGAMEGATGMVFWAVWEHVPARSQQEWGLASSRVAGVKPGERRPILVQTSCNGPLAFSINGVSHALSVRKC